MLSLRFPLRLVFLALLAGCSSVPEPGISWQGRSVKESYRVSRNLIYTPPQWPEEIPADLYQPESSGSSPAVLLIHGGGWTGKDGRWQMESIAR